MQKIILILLIALLGKISTTQAQDIEDSYQYVTSVDPQMKRKLLANEIMVDSQEKYLIVNYGNKPSYIIVYSLVDWKPIANFRLTNWVDFSGAYVDSAYNQIYIKESRYSSEYHRLEIPSGTKDIIECELTPRGCDIIEPQQELKTLYTSDRQYYFAINKRNNGEVRVYVHKDHK